VAERSFIKALNGGCSSPSAAYGVIQGEKIVLTGFYVDKNGKIYKMTKNGRQKSGRSVGIQLAMEMLKGADA